MQALQMTNWQSDPELREVPVPEPGPGQVLVRISGAGACHSDMNVMGLAPGVLPWKLPFTLGHENAGWVEEIGAGVDGVAVGDPVLVYGAWGCGYCRNCRQGMENYCENVAVHNGGAYGGGLGLDGGMAEFMLVPASRYLVPLTNLEPRDAASITDAALTPYHAIKRSLHLLGPGSSVVVIGVGGLGHVGIQILKTLSSAEVIALDITPEKLGFAREMGADHAVLSGPDAFDHAIELTHGRGADLVVDFVGSDGTLQLAAKLARALGHVTVVGQGEGRMTWSYFALPYECSVATTYWGSLPELMEVTRLAESGRLKCHCTYFALAQYAEAYQAMKAHSVLGRAVFTPGGPESHGE